MTAVFLATCIAALPLGAQQYSAPVDARVPFAPTPVLGSDGRVHCAYEIHLTNFYASNGPLSLQQISVFAEGSSTPLLTLQGKQLADIAKPIPALTLDGVTLPAGSRTVFLLWLSLPTSTAPPAALFHEMTFHDAKGLERKLHGIPVALPQQTAILIAPPLRGGRNWLITEGAGNPHSHHWGSLLALNGVVTIPQRYAVDFVGLNDRGHALEVAPDRLSDSANQDWFGYDSEVLAVADAVVRDGRDGQPDGKPMSRNGDESALTARGLYGNFIVLELAPGAFAHYAHLRPGSLQVHPGEHVHQGQVLAHLGDSGNSSAPHLHFHLSNRPTFEESEGIPFRFAKFTDKGPADESLVLSPAAVWSPRATECRQALPLDGRIVQFE